MNKLKIALCCSLLLLSAALTGCPAKTQGKSDKHDHGSGHSDHDGHDHAKSDKTKKS